MKGLNLNLLPKYLYYADYLVSFELSYRSIRKLGIFSNKDLDFVKTEKKEVALSSHGNYNNNVAQHLSEEELLALQNLRENKNIVIQKSDKDNCVVIVNKTDYLDKMESFLNGSRKFDLKELI